MGEGGGVGFSDFGPMQGVAGSTPNDAYRRKLIAQAEGMNLSYGSYGCKGCTARLDEILYLRGLVQRLLGELGKGFKLSEMENSMKNFVGTEERSLGQIRKAHHTPSSIRSTLERHARKRADEETVSVGKDIEKLETDTGLKE